MAARIPRNHLQGFRRPVVGGVGVEEGSSVLPPIMQNPRGHRIDPVLQKFQGSALPVYRHVPDRDQDGSPREEAADLHPQVLRLAVGVGE